MSPQVAAFVTLLRRNPIGAVCTILIIGLGVASWFLWQQIDDLELALEGRAKEGKDMLALLVGGSTQRQELAAVREAVRRIDENLVVEDDRAGNIYYFLRYEGLANARLSESHQLNSPASDVSTFYRRVPFSLRVTGTYEQVAAFLLAIETGPRLANITSFGFSRRGIDSDSIALDLNLELLGKK